MCTVHTCIVRVVSCESQVWKILYAMSKESKQLAATATATATMK